MQNFKISCIDPKKINNIVIPHNHSDHIGGLADFMGVNSEAKIEMWNDYGFKELSILDGNVGYLNLSVFFATHYAGKVADNAMNFFSNCNALIIPIYLLYKVIWKNWMNLLIE